MGVIEGICIPVVSFGRPVPRPPKWGAYPRSRAERDWVYLFPMPYTYSLEELREEFLGEGVDGSRLSGCDEEDEGGAGGHGQAPS